MAARPSEPLLRLLRDMARQKGLNTAALAAAAGLERARLKHVLAGSEALTVDEFMTLSQALGLSAEDLGLSAGQAGPELEDDEPDDPPPQLHAVGRRERPPLIPSAPDPLGNHTEQALRLAFSLGCDVLFVAESSGLEGSGVPRSVLAAYPKALPIKLDARFHRHNDPQYLPEGLRISLSFDSLYTCVFPWAAIQQVTFFPLPPEPPDQPDDEPEDLPAGLRRGHLRLIE